jgi:hypothetical protein
MLNQTAKDKYNETGRRSGAGVIYSYDDGD